MNDNEIYVAIRNEDALEYCKKQSMLEQMVGNETWRHYEYAAKALKTRIPKKVKYIETTTDNHLLGYCPSCTLKVLDENKFCCECGQALDWGE